MQITIKAALVLDEDQGNNPAGKYIKEVERRAEAPVRSGKVKAAIVIIGELVLPAINELLVHRDIQYIHRVVLQGPKNPRLYTYYGTVLSVALNHVDAPKRRRGLAAA